ncbi:MAG: zinc ABC transporter substrate-binding protein [Thermodesulfovibrionales bacterium]|nr:zinc ABC transporter substrate-binding protein [Thermodesulfovibrionales bacterium]
MKKLGLIIFVILFLVISCKNSQTPQNPEKKILIITTLFPLYDFTRQIVKDNGEVVMLLPPSVEPHSFEPTPSDIAKIHNADVIIFTSKNMEKWMEKIIKSLDTNKVKVIDASNGIDFLKPKGAHSHNGHYHDNEYDPHIWLDFENAQKMVDNIYKGISEKAVDKSEILKNNSNKYKEILINLDKKYYEEMSKCEKKIVLTGGHQTFNYLCNRYGLRCISAYGLSPNSEPSAKTLSGLTKTIKKEGLKYIFFEDVVNPRVSNTLSRETGTELLQIRSGHNLSAEEFKRGVTYQSLMEDNLKNLKKGLQCP